MNILDGVVVVISVAEIALQQVLGSDLFKVLLFFLYENL